MKYIDAEKLIAEIERRRNNALERQKNLEKIGQETVINELIADELNRLITFIKSFEKKHPINGLDEAAINHAYDGKPDKYGVEFEESNGRTFRQQRIDDFKVGAKWMAEQGIVVEGVIHNSCGYPSKIELNTYLEEYGGDKVIVQIRKAE